MHFKYFLWHTNYIAIRNQPSYVLLERTVEFKQSRIYAHDGYLGVKISRISTINYSEACILIYFLELAKDY